MESISSHGKFDRIVFLTQELCKQEVLLDMSTFFKLPFWKSLQIVLSLIFTLLVFRRNSLCIHCIVAVISLEIGKTAKNTNFHKANVLKIIVLPSGVRFLRRHILKLFQYRLKFFEILFWFNIFIIWKNIPFIFVAYLVKSVHLIPQTATTFRSPISATSQFDRFDFKPENDANREIDSAIL